MTAPSHTCASCATPLPEAAAFCHHCGAATPTQDWAPPRPPRRNSGSEPRSPSGIGWSVTLWHACGPAGGEAVTLRALNTEGRAPRPAPLI